MESPYIEPCCVGKHLPPLLRAQSLVTFQTNGDVTFEQFLRAISPVAGNEIAIRVMVPAVDIEMMRVLAWYARRCWLQALQVATAECQVGLITSEMDGTGIKPKCYHNSRIVESQIFVKGEKGAVVLQGGLFSAPKPGHRFYVAAFGSSDSEQVMSLVAATSSFFRSPD